MEHLNSQLICEFEVGDLVRLNEDTKLQIGYGLVTDIKLNFDDVYDLQYLNERIRSFAEILQNKTNDIFPSKPQILVLWSGKNTIDRSISLWMYTSEITIVQKVTRDIE